MMQPDPVVVVDQTGRPVGEADRAQVHDRPDLLHATVHVLVRTGRDTYLLQKRSAAKDVAPGLWDTSVGGHLVPGETGEEGARREMTEELGIPADASLTVLGTHVFRGVNESEYVTTFLCECDGPFSPDPGEIEEVAAFTREEILDRVGTGVFTPHFECQIEDLWGGDR